MRPVHVLPDALKVLIPYFRAALTLSTDPSTDGVTIGRTVDPDKQSPCVQLRLSAGAQATPAHDNPLVDFLVWHHTAEKSMALAQVLRAYGAAADGDPAGPGRVMFDVELMRPTDVIDPLDGHTAQVMFRQQFFIR